LWEPLNISYGTKFEFLINLSLEMLQVYITICYYYT